MKIRIKFAKHGALRFIGHLELMRYFQKAMRRADIDIAYSEGFSPHQIMSFAAPLGVGVISDGEYMDIEVHTSLSSTESICALNSVMADGITVLEYKELPENTKNAMSSVAAASYTVYFKDPAQNRFSEEQLSSMIQSYILDAKEILITKQTKKSEREIDLKPFIHQIQVIDFHHQPAVSMQVSAGSIENIKPELILQYLCEKAGIEYPTYALQILRNEVYALVEEQFVPLGDLGENLA